MIPGPAPEKGRAFCLGSCGSTGCQRRPHQKWRFRLRSGQGTGVTARVFVNADIAAGRLRQLFEDRDRAGYFMVTGPGIQRASLRRFTAWVMRQARAENFGAT